VPSLVTNLWQLGAGPSFRGLTRRLWPMLIGIVVGTVAGAGMLTGGATRWTAAALGAALCLYAAISLASWTWRVDSATERWLSL
ncbi:sulfite exporter TauE/SafE family protein, partial [Klebsiella pneumoniae]